MSSRVAAAALSGMGGIVGALGGAAVAAGLDAKRETMGTIVIGGTLAGAVAGAALGAGPTDEEKTLQVRFP